MKPVRPIGGYKKDLKRLSKRGWDLDKLWAVVSLIQDNRPLPSNAHPHKLGGVYEGLWECHIESDWLLIYNVTDEEVLLARTGTHADLFE